MFRVSPNVIVSSYAASRLGQFACEYGERFMLVLDPVLRSVGAAERIIQGLQERGMDFFVFDEIPEAADTATAEAALNLARSSHIQGVIAVGSGKTIEIARCVAAFFYEDRGIYSFADGDVPGKKNASPCGSLYDFQKRCPFYGQDCPLRFPEKRADPFEGAKRSLQDSRF